MKINNILYITITSLSIILLVVFGQKNRNVENKIKTKGIDTIGTVVNRTQGIGNGGITVFGVWFDFYVDGELIKSDQLLTGKSDYDQAIVGMKYKVKYLIGDPHTKSMIFINEPIKDEYQNIEEERDRIRSSYKNANVFLRKNARPINELKYFLE
ncbi:MAG TPA: hypothetical protein VE912_23485 [Bacteroidales bacterium]|nr:hypothetical protein [Bacteroidales bacterium]